ncbi:type II secretion system protein GspM [Roseateles cellulosilyticus]|uniref:Type II secretion system protein M n=1 Tax=Pelomonas cellulosilytica TaxID=2906762 RepID=A0ABS8XWA4_9BURK|nr:type II secretion system protein GspM [Pelomonas sp. P8]MCE4556208.1 type II secretion system protein M [Pelomonas sp. P8]
MARLPSPAAGNGAAAQLRQALAQARTQWRALSERDRLALGVVGVLLGLLLAWSVLLAPALRTLKAAPAELEALELELQRMQAQAQEARLLHGASPVPPAQATAALKASVEHLGSTARLNLVGDRATVTLADIAPPALQAWLAEVRAAARARPVEAQLTRSPRGFTGTLVLVVGGGA